MQLIDIMEDLDIVIEDIEAEIESEMDSDELFYKSMSGQLQKLRDISNELLDFWRDHKLLLKGKTYDAH